MPEVKLRSGELKMSSLHVKWSVSKKLRFLSSPCTLSQCSAAFMKKPFHLLQEQPMIMTFSEVRLPDPLSPKDSMIAHILNLLKENREQ